ncbi:hypothetical protein CR513_61681, partial [Mucuna pruriens]
MQDQGLGSSRLLERTDQVSGTLWWTNPSVPGHLRWNSTALPQRSLWEAEFTFPCIHTLCIDLMCMTRSSSNNLHKIAPEIDRTLYRLRKGRSANIGGSSSFISILESINNNCTTNHFDSFEYNSFDFKPNISNNKSHKREQMENNNRTLKKLATPDPTQSYELKYGLIHLLPNFHGLADEDPHKNLKEFHVGILEDYIKMKAFPFSLNGPAKDWLYLQLVLFNTWGDMKRMFLEKFFSASRTVTIRKEICGIMQQSGETLHEYWERFNKLCATCSHHQISEQLLIQYFYESLMMMDRNMIDAGSGRALMNEVDTIDNLRLENQLIELTSLVRQLTVRQHLQSAPLRVCGICTFVEHPTNMCSTL